MVKERNVKVHEEDYVHIKKETIFGIGVGLWLIGFIASLFFALAYIILEWNSDVGKVFALLSVSYLFISTIVMSCNGDD